MAENWEELNQKTIELLQSGQAEAAVAAAQEAVAHARERGAKEDLDVSLNNLGEVCQAAGDLPGAEAALKESLELERELYGEHDLRQVDAIYSLAGIYVATERFGLAQEQLKRAVELMERENAADPSVGAMLVELAEAYRRGGELDTAGDTLRRALKNYENTVGPGHPAFADALGRLAENYMARGGAQAAEPLLEQAIGILQHSLPADDPQIAAMMQKQAELFLTTGRMEKAQPLFKKVIAMYKKAYGKDTVEASLAQNDLGECYLLQGKLSDAKPLFESSLKSREAAYGPDHPAVAQSLNNLAELYEHEGHLAEALPLHERALDIRRRFFGERHVAVTQSLENLAAVYQGLGRLDEAEQLLRESVSIWQERYGQDHPAVAQANFNLATVLFQRAKYREAERTLEQVRDTMVAHLGEEDQNLILVYKALGVVSEKLGKEDKAKEYALLFGRLSQKYESKTLIPVCIAAYTGIAVFAFFLKSQWQFWVLAVVVGMFQGGVQALSRSHFAKIIPQEKSGEYFGLFDICGKGASFLGTMIVSVGSQLTGSANVGVGSIAILFVIGFVLFGISTRTEETKQV